MIDIVREEDLSALWTLRSHRGVQRSRGPGRGRGRQVQRSRWSQQTGSRQRETLLDASQGAQTEAEDGTMGVECGEGGDREPRRWTGRTWTIMVT